MISKQVGVKCVLTLIVDDEDQDLLTEYGNPGVASGGYVYLRTYHRGKQNNVLMHRIILARKLGRELTAGEQCDHKNGERADNRRANLRLATHSQNSANRRKATATASKYIGVARGRKRWEAYVMANHRRIHIGTFDSETEAARARDRVAFALHGEFARLNNV